VTMKKNSWLGTISLYHCVPKTPAFQESRSWNLSNHLFIRKLKESMLHGLSTANPNFSHSPFLEHTTAA
jgi:hypothetical protein